MKNRYISIVLLALGLMLFCPVLKAQVAVERSTELVKVGGKEYFMHYVKSGQTLHSIAQAYMVSVEEIEKLNPELKDGLKAGYVIGIPVNPLLFAEPEPVVEPKPEPIVEPEPVVEKPEGPSVAIKRSTEIVKIGNVEYYMHRVEQGQTLYAISKEYNVPVSEIERINPETKKGLKVGYVIGIPVVKEPEPEPVVEPEPEPIVEPEPEPIVEPEPEPVIEPEPEPIVEPEPEPVIEPEPEPVIEPEPEPIVEPEAIIEPEPVVEKPEDTTVRIKRSTEIMKIGNVEYYMHCVEQGQTLYAISKEYDVPVSEIERINPEVKKGLKAGSVIGIPVLKGPEPEPIIEPKPIIEPEPEPIIEPEPEPIIEPEPEPIIEPEPEPIIEPEPEPIIEPEPEPIIEPEPEPVIEPEPEPIVEPEPELVIVKVGGQYTVQKGEDLYDIAKKFGIDLADFKAINPNLTNTPKAGTVIKVPDIVNQNDYIMHKVESNERLSSLLKRWKVDESEFRDKNVSVGSYVFVNQFVLIPIDPVLAEKETPAFPPELDEEEPEQPQDEPVATVEDEEPYVRPDCNVSAENAKRRYKVALMIPLYLQDLDNLYVSKENLARAQKSRALSFLQYYEGFMMAVDKLTKQHGLKLDLTVIDVTDNVSTAHSALAKIEKKDLDMIIGPFFGKSFAIVEEYAKEHGIIMVNPLSTRESVVEGNDNVVKIKPSMNGQILGITSLVKNHYPNANVFIISREKDEDTLFLNHLENQLNLAVNEEVKVSNEDFLQYAKDESERMEMGEKMVSTINVEGQVYSIKDLQDGKSDGVVLQNTVKRGRTAGSIMSGLSGVRDNVIVVYGNDNVFATQTLNGLKRAAGRCRITLVATPDWTRFEKLLVDNLLKMNAIYVTDHFVDYNDKEVKRFVLQFRRTYSCEPKEYAFEGYDVAWYFLNALMRYGTDMLGCLPYYDTPLLHTHFYFMDKGRHNGLENQYWNMYQYDKESIELKPIDPFSNR